MTQTEALGSAEERLTARASRCRASPAPTTIGASAGTVTGPLRVDEPAAYPAAPTAPTAVPADRPDPRR